MALTLEDLEEKLLSLPEDNRIRLVSTLLESLPTPSGVMEEGTPEFEAELDRRCEEIDNGTATLIPYDVVMREIRDLLERG
jgi:putative addiction module component (TIGR02574 family)